MPFWWRRIHHQGPFRCQSLSSRSPGDVPVERGTSAHQSCHSGDLRSCWSWPLPARVPRVHSRGIWIALLKKESLSPKPCTVLSYIISNAILLCAWDASQLLWVKERSLPCPSAPPPTIPWNRTGDYLSVSPHVLRIVFPPPPQYRSLLSQQACGIVWLFLGRIFQWAHHILKWLSHLESLPLSWTADQKHLGGINSVTLWSPGLSQTQSQPSEKCETIQGEPKRKSQCLPLSWMLQKQFVLSEIYPQGPLLFIL